MDINTIVSIPKTSACINPTKTSSIRNTVGANTGSNVPITNNKTIPAKILPNKRKEKEIIFEISDTMLEAEAAGELYNKDIHPIKTAVKAVTYHGLSITEQSGVWQATTVLDI